MRYINEYLRFFETKPAFLALDIFIEYLEANP